jgi:hypothetical protein
VAPLTAWMLALWAETTSLLSWLIAFEPIESPGWMSSVALVILPELTVICTSTWPYWVFSVGPVNVPDLPAGALVLGAAAGVVAGAVGFLVVAGAVGVTGALVVGAVDAGAVDSAAVGDADAWADADGLVLGAASDFDADAEADADADADPAGPVDGAALLVSGLGSGAAAATAAEWVLNENSAASPATVPPTVRTARRKAASC